MLFLLTAFALESKCKSTKNISYGKKNIPTCPGKGVSLQRLWDRRCEDETIHIYSIRPAGRGAGGAGSGGAGIADDAVPAAGVVAVLPLVAAAAAVASGLVAGKYICGYQRRGGMTATQKAGAVGVMTVMVLLSTFVFIPAGSVARVIVPVAGAVGALTVVFFVPNAKNDDI